MAEDEWTRSCEVRQRLCNCYRFMRFAWLSLWTDSTLLAAVVFNSVRDEGDGLITRLTMKDGRRINVPKE